MKIALLGYGRMGKEIEKIALERNHTIGLIIDKDNIADLNADKLKNIDVCIDFSNPDSAYDNIVKCLNTKTPIVSGTTGWIDKLEEIVQICEEKEGTFFYASNYSLGVNIFFKMNTWLAKVMNNYQQYSVSASETHHVQKKDAPSGTAISLLNDIIANAEKYTDWSLDPQKETEIPVEAHRVPDVPGTHEITYDSEIDTIEILHRAKSRKGFALGAVLAAEFIKGKQGYFTMNDLLKVD